jgi:hypothetical protein
MGKKKQLTPEQQERAWKDFNDSTYNQWGELHRFIVAAPKPVSNSTCDFAAHNWQPYLDMLYKFGK